MAVTYPKVILGGETGTTLSGTGVTTNLKILGNGGNDTLIGVSGYQNYLDGGEGNDTITGGSKDDELFGGSGSGIDTIKGGGGVDTIDGGDGGDFLYGEGNIDWIYGRGGNDTINGGADADNLFGEAGADTFRGITSGDTINVGLNDLAKDKLVFANGDIVGTFQKNSSGDIIATAAPKVSRFQRDPNLANDVDTFDKIDLTGLRAGTSGNFIFDSAFSPDVTGLAGQKSIYIHQTKTPNVKPDGTISYFYKNYVAIDYKGTNDYEIVLEFMDLNSAKLTASDFLL